MAIKSTARNVAGNSIRRHDAKLYVVNALSNSLSNSLLVPKPELRKFGLKNNLETSPQYKSAAQLGQTIVDPVEAHLEKKDQNHLTVGAIGL